MRTRTAKKLALAAAAVAVLAVPGVAHASMIGEEGVTLTCDNEEADQGDDVNCVTGGWDPATDLGVLVTLNPTLLDETYTTSAAGTVSFSFSVPDDAPDGEISIALSGTVDGQAYSISADSGIVGDGDPTNDGAVDADDEDIADTGADAGILALAAIVAVGLGSAALFAARKRTTT